MGLVQDLDVLKRNEMKKLLPQCTDAQQKFFKRVYSFKDQDKDISKIVDDFPAEKLDTIIGQIERTLNKNQTA